MKPISEDEFGRLLDRLADAFMTELASQRREGMMFGLVMWLSGIVTGVGIAHWWWR